MTDVSIPIESSDVKEVVGVSEVAASPRKSRQANLIKRKFVESPEFHTHTLSNLEHVKKSAEHWAKARPERPYIAHTFLDMLGNPVTKGRSVAHVLWDVSRKSMPLLIPDEHTLDYSPLTTLMTRCFCGSHEDEVAEAFFWEAFRRMPTDREVERAVKRLASMSDDEDGNRLSDGSNPVLVNFWVALMGGVETLCLAQSILASTDVNVTECPYFTEFPEAFKNFNDKLVLDQNFWVKKCLAELPEMKDVDDAESKAEEVDSDDEEESSSVEDEESKGFDEGSDDNDDGDFDGKEDATDSDAKAAEENGHARDDDDEVDDLHPKKKARVAKGFRARPEGSRTSSRLSKIAKVNLEERAVSDEDNDDDDDESDDVEKDQVDDKATDEKEDEHAANDAPKTDVATSVVADNDVVAL
jgi:hypothetical protein